jgi:RimJ/RimL family protein N-acetyltransferase
MPKRPKFERLKPWLPLRTPRLVLREFRESDFDAVHAYGADPEVARFMVWGPNTPEETRAFLDRVQEQQAGWPRPSVNTAVELADSGRLIGSAELRVVHSENQHGEFGYCFHRDVWGQGYGPEAAGALIRQGFEEMGLHRITATCDVRNRKSWRVMEKLGMRREAMFREDVRVKRRWRDTYLYAILAEEWRACS